MWGLKWVWCTPPSSQVQGMLRGLCRHLRYLWQALAVSPHLMYPALPLHAAPGESPEQAAAPPCGVPSLREVCVARIRACLAPGNVCSVLHAVEVLAGAVEELRAPCLECLATHLPQVVAEDGPQFCALSLGCLLELLRGPDVVRLPPRVSGVSCAQPVLLKSSCVWGFDMVRLPVWVCCLCVMCHAWCGLLSGELDAHCPDSPCWSYRYICLALTTCALSSHAVLSRVLLRLPALCRPAARRPPCSVRSWSGPMPGPTVLPRRLATHRRCPQQLWPMWSCSCPTFASPR